MWIVFLSFFVFHFMSHAWPMVFGEHFSSDNDDNMFKNNRSMKINFFYNDLKCFHVLHRYCMKKAFNVSLRYSNSSMIMIKNRVQKRVFVTQLLNKDAPRAISGYHESYNSGLKEVSQYSNWMFDPFFILNFIWNNSDKQ